MAEAIDLLRLLEPTVRPAGTPALRATPAASVSAPGGFEALLSQRTQALSAPSAAGDTAPTAAASPALHSALPPAGTPFADDPIATPVGLNDASPLAALAGIDRVENPTLRSLLGQRAA